MVIDKGPSISPDTNNFRLQLVIFICACLPQVNSQFAPLAPVSGTDLPPNPLTATLAVGGFVQGLLGVQIRTRPGFYENIYQNLSPVSLVGLQSGSSTSAGEVIAMDGRLLRLASQGMGPTPCYESERLSRNRLLAVACILQQQYR